MDFKRGTVAVSAAGRDKTHLMVVVDVDEKRVRVCDGRERKLNNPKSKNPRHLMNTGATVDLDLIESDRALRKALKEAADGFKEAN